MTRHIVIDLFEDAEELDVVGPWEVLASWTRHHPHDGWRVHLVTDDGLPRRCAKGLVLAPTAARDDVRADVVVEPGGVGSRRRAADAAHLRWLRDQAGDGAILASVCTGALVLAAAGLLRGRPVTTYHAAFDELVAADPSVEPRPGDRWVDDGTVLTAGGVSAGIDLALHLVGRVAGPARAVDVQDTIEYHPEPPTWDVPTDRSIR